jgi:hypothetical protein
LLFNIGQCHRQLGHKQEAITFFRTYLREVSDAPNRDEVKRLMSTLEQEVAAERASKASPPQGPIEPPADARAHPSPPAALVVTAPPNPVRHSRSRVWIWGVVAGGAAAIALGVGLGVGLSSSERDPTPSLGSVTKN